VELSCHPKGTERPVAIDTSGWVGPKSGLEVLEKNRLPMPGIQPLIVQPSQYTDYASQK